MRPNTTGQASHMGGYEIVEHDAVVGDNVYLREVDFQSYEVPAQVYPCPRNTEMENLLKACPNYAIWDDHDFGPNDSDGSWVQIPIGPERHFRRLEQP